MAVTFPYEPFAGTHSGAGHAEVGLDGVRVLRGPARRDAVASLLDLWIGAVDLTTLLHTYCTTVWTPEMLVLVARCAVLLLKTGTGTAGDLTQSRHRGYSQALITCRPCITTVESMWQPVSRRWPQAGTVHGVGQGESYLPLHAWQGAPVGRTLRSHSSSRKSFIAFLTVCRLCPPAQQRSMHASLCRSSMGGWSRGYQCLHPQIL